MNYSLFENIDKPLMVLDKYGLINYSNQYASEIFHIGLSDFSGKHFSCCVGDNLTNLIGRYLKKYFFYRKELVEKVDLHINDSSLFEITMSPLIYDTLFSITFSPLNKS